MDLSQKGGHSRVASSVLDWNAKETSTDIRVPNIISKAETNQPTHGFSSHTKHITKQSLAFDF